MSGLLSLTRIFETQPNRYRPRGLKYLSKKRPERIHGIAHTLKDSTYDIIGFQELWADYDTVKSVLRNTFPYSKYWHTAAFGSGLAIFSKFPIVGSSVLPFSLNGSPSDPAGDWFVGKAVVSAVISHPKLGEIEVFNTHVCELYIERGWF
jgi:sphingomyelin phosphodiesterase 2